MCYYQCSASVYFQVDVCSIMAVAILIKSGFGKLNTANALVKLRQNAKPGGATQIAAIGKGSILHRLNGTVAAKNVI